MLQKQRDSYGLMCFGTGGNGQQQSFSPAIVQMRLVNLQFAGHICRISKRSFLSPSRKKAREKNCALGCEKRWVPASCWAGVDSSISLSPTLSLACPCTSEGNNKDEEIDWFFQHSQKLVFRARPLIRDHTKKNKFMKPCESAQECEERNPKVH